MRWFKKTTKVNLRNSYHVYIKDSKHLYDNHPKEDEFTLVLITLSHPIARLFMEVELDRQGYNWFYNELSNKFMIIGRRESVGYIRTITSSV